MIDPKSTSLFSAYRQDRATTTNPSGADDKARGYQPKGREIFDTVELSGGEKQVNLARSDTLGAEIRAEKDPQKIADMLSAGAKDINRIGRLFHEVIKAFKALFAR